MKKIVCILLCLATLLSLAACGAPETTTAPVQNNEATHTPVNGQTTATTPTEEAVDMEYTLSEYLATGETIWYQLSKDKGKDSKVEYVYVLEPDGTLYRGFCDGCETLGDYEQMADADIAAQVKETHYWILLDSLDRHFLEKDNTIAMQELRWDFTDISVFLNSFPEAAECTQEYLESTGFPSVDILMDCYNAYNKFLLKHSWLWEQNDFHELMQRTVGFIDCIVWEDDENEASCTSILKNNYSMTDEMLGELRGIAQDFVTALDTIYAAKRSEVESKLRALKADAKPNRYALSIRSDSTGNRTESMKFVILNVTNGSNHLDRYTIEVCIPGNNVCGTVVYDSIYGGYYFGSSILYTKASGELTLNLDKIGESDLPVDVEDYESLFN